MLRPAVENSAERPQQEIFDLMLGLASVHVVYVTVHI
jgi:hypothetical protein